MTTTPLQATREMALQPWWLAASPRLERLRTSLLALALLSGAAVGSGQGLDTTFDAQVAPNIQFTSYIYATAVQPDGKVLIGGNFTSILGVARNRIARLNADGTLDAAFNPGADDDVYCITVQPDGKILVGGFFNNVGGQARPLIARLNATTGAADTTFNANAVGTNVFTVAVQTDGNIVVGGVFTSMGGQARVNLARLGATGTADSFNPSPSSTVRALAIQRDGKILVGGLFTTIAGQTRNRIARFDSAGTLDSFDPNVSNSVVRTFAIQADGKILVGGQFTGTIGGQARTRIARLDPLTGAPDSFNPLANQAVYSIVVQADGKILVGGIFTSIGGAARNRIARLDSTGVADSFDPNADDAVNGITLLTNGMLMVGGNYVTIGGGSRSFLARLSNDTPATQSLAATASSVTWTRGGSSVQFNRVTFESSTDGVTYSSLGAGTPSGSNWTLTGLSLPTSQSFYVRARGYYRTGYQGGSEAGLELVQIIAVAPTVTTPTSASVTTTTATLGGNATSDGGAAITARGVVYSITSTNNNPLIGGSGVSNVAAGTGTGVFTAGVTGLSSATGYSFKAYATNAVGTSYTSVGTFSTPSACPTITLAALPNGIVNASYPGVASASGGSGSYTYSLTSGSLPTGLVLNPSTGALATTPSVLGAFNFQITATDTAAPGTCTGVRNYTVHIGSAVAAGDLVIREFRLRGPASATDEYVVVHSRAASPITVAATDGSAGFAVASSDNSVVFTIPNGTVIPARGHFLGVNTSGYSLGGASDASWTTDIADSLGLALFKTSTPANFTSPNVLDAVGVGASAAPYLEGTALISLTTPGEYAWVRKAMNEVVQDTGANSVDFVLVATNGAVYNTVQSILGAPAPTRSTMRDVYASMAVALIEPNVGVNLNPNRLRVLAGGDRLEFRRRLTNNTGTTLNSIRLRFNEIATFNSPGYSPGTTQADLRPGTSATVTITATSIGATSMTGLTLLTPPAQAMGGGWNSILTLPGSLAPGASIDVNIALYVTRAGSYRYFATIEAQ